MVTQINNNKVAAVMNGTTTEVANLKKTYSLGSFGYNFFKTFSFLLSTAARKEMIKAEARDNLPTQIKATADKVAELLASETSPIQTEIVRVKQTDGFSRKLTNKSVFNAALRTAIGHVPNGAERKATKKVSDQIEALLNKTQQLANAYGEDSADYMAYVKGLVVEKVELNGGAAEIEDFMGNHFFGAQALKVQTRNFAGQSALAIIDGFTAFCDKMGVLFGGTEAGVTNSYYRTLKTLCKTDALTTVENYKSAHQGEGLDREIASRQVPVQAEASAKQVAIDAKQAQIDAKQAEIDATQAQINGKFAELAVFRGTNGFSGSVHEAWVDYMQARCKYILCVDEASASLSQDERSTLQALVLDRRELHRQEAYFNGIANRPEFAMGRVNVITITESDVSNFRRGIPVAAVEVQQKLAAYNAVNAQLVALIGDVNERDTSVTDANGQVIAVKTGSPVQTFVAEKQAAKQALESSKVTLMTEKEVLEQAKATILTLLPVKEQEARDDFAAKVAKAQVIIYKLATAKEFFSGAKEIVEGVGQAGIEAFVAANKAIGAAAPAA